jgi:hypothetical protein
MGFNSGFKGLMFHLILEGGCSRMQPLGLHVMSRTILSAYDVRGNHFQECIIHVQKVTCTLTELRLIHR